MVLTAVDADAHDGWPGWILAQFVGICASPAAKGPGKRPMHGKTDRAVVPKVDLATRCGFENPSNPARLKEL